MPRPRSLLAAAIMSLVAVPAGAQTSNAPQPPANATTTVSIERAVAKQINAFRARHHRAPVRTNVKLVAAARDHSAWMAATGLFQHEGPNGQQFWQRLVAHGVNANIRMSENIAMTDGVGCPPDTAAQLVRMWINSPEHLRNIMDPKVHFTGVGIAVVGGCDQLYATADYSG